MKIYKSKYSQLSGTSYDEIVKKAHKEHNEIRRRTKRQPYIRSKYFKKDKIFINLFWEHLNQKNRHDRQRRLKLYPCAIDLIRNTTFDPIPKPNPNKPGEVLHRFAGESKDGELFFVQIKETLRSGRKDFISVFSIK
jgi:hypothetical protein